MLASWRALLNRMLSFAHVFRRCGRGGHSAIVRSLRAAGSRGLFAYQASRTCARIPRRMLQFNKLVDDVVELARERKVVKLAGLKKTPKQWGYGRYLRLGSQDADLWAGAWFGIDYTLWARYQDTPIWLSFSSNGWEGVISVDDLRKTLGKDIWANTPSSIRSISRLGSNIKRCCLMLSSAWLTSPSESLRDGSLWNCSFR